MQNIFNKIIEVSKSKNKIIRVVHRAALIYAILLTIKRVFTGKKSEKVTKA